MRLWFQTGSKKITAKRMNCAERTVIQYIDRARIKYTANGRPALTSAHLLARAIEDGLIRTDEVRDDY